MAHSALKAFKGGPITAIDAQQGTTVHLAYGESNSTVVAFTISGATIATIGKYRERIQCMVSDGTYLYCGMGRRLVRITISGGAISELERYKVDIQSISRYSSTLYIGLVNGDFNSY
jgi:hypothetical protein